VARTRTRHHAAPIPRAWRAQHAHAPRGLSLPSCLRPGLNALGALPILLGLAIILHEGRAQHAHDAQAKLLAPLEPSAHEPQPDVYAAPPDRYEAPRTEQQGVGGTRSARVVPAGSAA